MCLNVLDKPEVFGVARKMDRSTMKSKYCTQSATESKNNLVAEYSLKDMSKPIGVSEYKITSNLPDELINQLPSVEDIQKRVYGEVK